MTAGGQGGGDELEQAGSRPVVVETADDGAASRPSRARWDLFLGLSIAVVVVDQLAKAWLVQHVGPGEMLIVLGDWIRLLNSHNSGALFGMFRDQAIVFALASIGVIGLIVGYHARSPRSAYMSVALGLLLGGAIGNFIDRLRLGYVVDFVDIGIGSVRFYTFNVADSAITLAILMLLATAIFPRLTAGEQHAVRTDG
jgi:signal peptidase II